MEFVAKQSALLRELNLVHGVVEKKTTVPILANVLLTAVGDSVSVMGTDLDVSVRSVVAAQVMEEGALCISSAKLHEIVRALPDSEIHFKSDEEKWATIECERSRFRIMGLGKDDFPTLPSPGDVPRVTLGVQQFKEMVQKVIFAVSVEDARFALNGALMVLDRSTMTLVASDGHRLAYVSGRLAAPAAVAQEIRVVIPQKALSQLSRIAEEMGGEIIFCKDENRLFFEMGRCLLTSKLLEGQFPNYEKVLPRGNDKIVELDRVAFGDALRRVSLLANERSRAVRVALSSGKMEISAKNPELGEATETLGVEYTGSDMEAGFNAKYILDFLGVVECSRVVFEMKDEATQGLLRPLAPAEQPAKQPARKGKAAPAAEPGPDYKYVIMPMRI